jgi:hypothetical protein
MKNKSKTYKFSTVEVVQYISQNIDVTNEVVKIIKSKTPNVDKKTTDRIVIVNDLMSKVGDLINVVGEKFNIDTDKIDKITTSINNITHIITLILKDITPKIISLAVFASFAIPSLIISRLYIIALAWFVRATFRSLGLIANFKIAMIKTSFSNLVEITDNLIYISKKLSMLGLVSRIIIPLLFASRMYIQHLGKFMRTLYWAFSVKKTIKISILKIYFDKLNVVSDLILSVTGKLIKLGAITLLTRWTLKSATKYIVQLYMFNSLILTLFRKRDIIDMLVMEKYFEVLSDVIVNIISISNRLIRLRFIVSIANRGLKKYIFKYIVNLGILCHMLTHFFGVRDVIKLKLIQIQFKILNDVINSITQIAKKIIKNAIFLIIANHLIKKVNIFIWRLKKFVNNLKHLFKISVVRLIGIKFKLRILRGIVNQLILLSSSIIILGLISFIAIPALVVNTIYVIALGAFIKILQIMLRIAKIKLKDIFALIMLIVVLGLLIVMAYELKKLNDIGSQLKWSNLFMVMGGILAMAAYAILIGTLAMAMLPIIGMAVIGLVALIVMIGLVVLIALALEYIQSIELNGDLINKNIDIILGLAENIRKRVLLDKKEDTKNSGVDGEEKNWIDQVLTTLGNVGEGIIQVLCHFGSLAMTLLSVVLIKFIADQLNSLQNITLDSAKIMDVVNIVLDVSRTIITDVLFGAPDYTPETASDENRGVIESIIDFVGPVFRPLVGLLQAICSVPILLSTIISVGMLFVIAKMLNKINEINIDRQALNTKISDIITIAKGVSDQIFGNNENDSALKKTWNVIKSGTEAVGDILSAGVFAAVMPALNQLDAVVKVLKGIQDLDSSKLGQTETIVKDVVRIAKIVCDEISKNNLSGSNIDGDKIEGFEKYVDTSIKYFKSINKLDTSKIRSIGDMYEKMGQFMDKLQDAPINDIADALVNKISPALSDINTSLNKKPTQTNQITQTTTPTTTPVVTQTTPNNPVASNQPIKQIDYSGMLENIEDLLEQIKKKLNSQPQPAF